jgi:hypothetical protein
MAGERGEPIATPSGLLVELAVETEKGESQNMAEKS